MAVTVRRSQGILFNRLYWDFGRLLPDKVVSHRTRQSSYVPPS